jgi:hypothetical protein
MKRPASVGRKPMKGQPQESLELIVKNNEGDTTRELLIS